MRYTPLRLSVVTLCQAKYHHIMSRVDAVHQWNPEDPRVIRRENPDGLFTTANPQTRELIDDLDALPLTNEDGTERAIFSADGRRVPRRIALTSAEDPPLPLLQDLSRTHTLFTCNGNYQAEEDEEDEQVNNLLGGALPGYCNVPYYVYPQGFTKTLGQWQANGLMLALQRKLNRFARSLTLTEDGPLCIEGVKSQMYNTTAHSVRPSSKAHIAQRGYLTAASAGAWALDERAKVRAKYLKNQVDTSLPHARLSNQLRNIR